MVLLERFRLGFPGESKGGMCPTPIESGCLTPVGILKNPHFNSMMSHANQEAP